MKTLNIIEISTNEVPVISIDAGTKAIYIKFSDKEIAKTIDESVDDNLITTIDLDSNGDVVGVEFIGISKISINSVSEMLEKLQIEDIPDLSQAEIKVPSLA